MFKLISWKDQERDYRDVKYAKDSSPRPETENLFIKVVRLEGWHVGKSSGRLSSFDWGSTDVPVGCPSLSQIQDTLVGKCLSALVKPLLEGAPPPEIEEDSLGGQLICSLGRATVRTGRKYVGPFPYPVPPKGSGRPFCSMIRDKKYSLVVVKDSRWTHVPISEPALTYQFHNSTAYLPIVSSFAFPLGRVDSHGWAWRVLRENISHISMFGISASQYTSNDIMAGRYRIKNSLDSLEISVFPERGSHSCAMDNAGCIHTTVENVYAHRLLPDFEHAALLSDFSVLERIHSLSRQGYRLFSFREPVAMYRCVSEYPVSSHAHFYSPSFRQRNNMRCDLPYSILSKGAVFPYDNGLDHIMWDARFFFSCSECRMIACAHAAAPFLPILGGRAVFDLTALIPMRREEENMSLLPMVRTIMEFLLVWPSGTKVAMILNESISIQELVSELFKRVSLFDVRFRVTVGPNPVTYVMCFEFSIVNDQPAYSTILGQAIMEEDMIPIFLVRDNLQSWINTYYQWVDDDDVSAFSAIIDAIQFQLAYPLVRNPGEKSCELRIIRGNVDRKIMDTSKWEPPMDAEAYLSSWDNNNMD